LSVDIHGQIHLLPTPLGCLSTPSLARHPGSSELAEKKTKEKDNKRQQQQSSLTYLSPETKLSVVCVSVKECE